MNNAESAFAEKFQKMAKGIEFAETGQAKLIIACTIKELATHRIKSGLINVLLNNKGDIPWLEHSDIIPLIFEPFVNDPEKAFRAGEFDKFLDEVIQKETLNDVYNKVTGGQNSTNVQEIARALHNSIIIPGEDISEGTVEGFQNGLAGLLDSKSMDSSNTAREIVEILKQFETQYHTKTGTKNLQKFLYSLVHNEEN